MKKWEGGGEEEKKGSEEEKKRKGAMEERKIMEKVRGNSKRNRKKEIIKEN